MVRSPSRRSRSTSSTIRVSDLANLSSHSLRCSTCLAASPRALREEELDGGVVEPVVRRHRRQDERRSPGSHVTDRDCRLRPRPPQTEVRAAPPEEVASVPQGRRSTRGPPPPSHLRSSVPVGAPPRSAAQATHSSERCGGDAPFSVHHESPQKKRATLSTDSWWWWWWLWLWLWWLWLWWWWF